MHPLTLFLLASCLPNVQLMEDLKALEEFVNRPDPHYKYTFVKTKMLPFWSDVTFQHSINMTSQKWLDETEVDKPVWSHVLDIIIPKRTKIGASCLLIINSGKTAASETILNDKGNLKLAYLSVTTKSAVAVLNTVPVQPLTFYNHPLGWKNIKEYDIMAYSWWRFINDSSVPPEWLVQFPMVKATVRAMDTVTDYMMETYQKNITEFTLIGVVMNGWTTWLTAAVDKRVAAIIPIAMDFLNFTENFLHQYRAYCGWSYGLKPFHDMNIMQKMDNSRFSLLASLLDPLSYNEQYTNISKLIIVVSGEEVFLPDNSRYYINQLEGPNLLNIIPNSDFRFQGTDKTIMNPITSFQYRIANDYPLPTVSWQITTTNMTKIIHFRAKSDPKDVFCYYADTVGDTSPGANSGKSGGCRTEKTDMRADFQLMDLKALDEFVNLPGPHYGYPFVKKQREYFQADNIFIHTLNMTSQKWLDGK
ncbi:autocrine proliferation repressor protein A-like [Heteronotia binoei]|uniref:autocrine proliferation repressor protein A-like n=1 Tax=Heteronotia binoei TaxID=13085 RepID=UPI0029319598|nr:autocrine proliferation repressor protein A-like [Heteronotia binoei]